MTDENGEFPNCCFYIFIFFAIFGCGMALITMYNYPILGIIVIIGGVLFEVLLLPKFIQFIQKGSAYKKTQQKRGTVMPRIDFSSYSEPKKPIPENDLQHPRNISTKVRREVWRRDQGKCVRCGSQTRMEFDHIIPFSKGGSNTARNIQLLCEKCNREKYNSI